jgi:hypothetical protein
MKPTGISARQTKTTAANRTSDWRIFERLCFLLLGRIGFSPELYAIPGRGEYGP